MLRLMNPFRIAFAGTFAARLAEPVQAHLGIPCDVIVDDESGIVSRLPEVDVVATLASAGGVGGAARRLNLVQVPGAGLDRIDRAALPHSAWLANAYGHEVGIAEYVLGAILALTRSFARLDAALRCGKWESQWALGVAPPPPWPELAGKTLSILGYGRIGQCVARRAHAFEMTVLGIRRNASQPEPHGVSVRGPDALDDVLTRADYLAVTLPLTPETRGLLGERELRAMKPTTVLVNISRAEIVDEDALYEALVERRIRGAALDVWYRYPSGPGPTGSDTRRRVQLPGFAARPAPRRGHPRRRSPRAIC